MNNYTPRFTLFFPRARTDQGPAQLPTWMERGEDLLATEGLFRVALLVHLNPKLVRLVDTLRRHRDVADDDVGALVPRNLAFRFHHSVFIRTVAQN